MYGGMRGLSTAVFEAEAFGGQLINLYPTKPVTNFPAYATIDSRDIALRLADQAERFGAGLFEWQPIEHVGHDGDDFVIRAGPGGGAGPGDPRAGREVRARALILALGLGRFTPRRLGLDDEARFEGKGLTYRLPPIDEIDARHVVVVGGGDSALDTALSLRTVTDVTIVHRREEFSAFAFSRQRLAEADIKLVTNGEIVGLAGRDRLERVVIARTDGSTVECPADLLMVSIGQVPELSGIKGWELGLDDSRLPVTSAMAASAKGLFAAGDYADYPGKVKMIATAVAEGSTAASSAERYLLSMS